MANDQRDVTKLLSRIIYSSKSLPLSLLFNTGKYYEDSTDWIPKKLAGDVLVEGPLMSWITEDGSPPSTSPSELRITGTKDPRYAERIFVLAIDVRVASIASIFHLWFKGEEYIVEINPNWINDGLRRPELEVASTYIIIIDKITGSDALNGYTARGCCLSGLLESVPGATVWVAYHSPITLYSMQQWQHTDNTFIPEA